MERKYYTIALDIDANEIDEDTFNEIYWDLEEVLEERIGNKSHYSLKSNYVTW